MAWSKISSRFQDHVDVWVRAPNRFWYILHFSKGTEANHSPRLDVPWPRKSELRLQKHIEVTRCLREAAPDDEKQYEITNLSMNENQ